MKTLMRNQPTLVLIASLALSACSDMAGPTDPGPPTEPSAKPAAGSACVPAPPGLLAWWPAEGTAQDATGGNDGALLHGAGFAPGLVGQAFQLDGVDDQVSVPDSPDLDITGDISLSAWFRSDGPDGGMILNKEDPTAAVRTGYALHVNPPFPATSAIAANSVAVNFFSPSGGHVSVNSRVSGDLTNYNDGVFHHVVGAYSASEGQARLYIDGALVGTSPQAPIASIGTNDVPLSIGDRPGTPLPLAGLVDDASIFGRALSPAEVASLFAAGSAGMCADPVTKDDCKRGGWEEYGFRNQGQCVRFTVTGKDSR